MIHQFLFEPIYQLSHDILIKNLALILSYPVTYGVILVVLIWALIFSKRKMYNFSFTLLSGVTAWFMAHFIKVLLRVPRPFVEMNFTPIYHETGFSFPSEHVAVLTVLGFAVAFSNRKFGSFLLAIALLVGVSRVVLGVHYPIDILGGILVGYLVYLPYRKLFSKF